MKQLLWLVLIAYGIPLSAQITFSEMMFDPIGDENSDEWIEIYNTSDSLISLEGWTIQVDGSVDSLRIYESAASGWGLQPREFAIVHDSDYPDGSQSYESIIPDSVPRFIIADSRFGQYGLSNSNARLIQLIDTTESVISEYQYSPNNPEGYTDEKVILTGVNDSENWENSNSLNGTPGFKNSVSPKDYDLALIPPATWFPDPPLPDSEIQVSMSVKNVGLLSAENASLSIGRDENTDSTLQTSEILETLNIPPLDSGDSTNLVFEMTLPSGVNQVVTHVNFPADENTSNNNFVWKIPIQFEPGIVVINEIMYAPEEGPEWVEMYNRSSEPIDLKNWTIADASGNIGLLQSGIYSILPDSFAVITAEPNIANYYPELSPELVAIVDDLPTLNNSSDAVVIRSSAGNVQDSVFYSSNWGGITGKSLERINPDETSFNDANWGECQSVSGATPGRMNSIAAKEIDLAVNSIEIIEDESLVFQCVIQNRGRTSQSGWSLQLYHDLNEDDILQQSEILQTKGGILLEPGDSTAINFSLAETFHGFQKFSAEVQLNTDQSAENNVKWLNRYFAYPDSTILINEVMYHPETGEPEWIELYVARDSVDLRGWIVRDAGHSGKAVAGGKHLYHSDEYILLATDESVLQSYPNLDLTVVKVSEFPTFNNGSDSVRIFDATSHLLDEFKYSSTMGGDVGVSLERVNLFALTTNPDNWGSSIADIGATPGAVNSIAILENDLVIKPSSITTSPEFPEPGQIWTISFKISNGGLNPISGVSAVLYEDINTNGIFEQNEIFYQNSIDLNLTSGDSTEIQYTLPAINQGVHKFILFVSSSGEMRPSDNSALFQVESPFSDQTLLITEFAPIPGEGWSEFIEVYNPSADTISLENWRVSDNASSAEIPHHDLEILPKSYGVFAPDSSITAEFTLPEKVCFAVIPEWRSLNNSGDMIILHDPTGKTIDSVSYSSDWNFLGGVSKERRWYLGDNLPIKSWESINWLNSQSGKGATPGKLNTQTVVSPRKIAISIDSLPKSIPPSSDLKGKAVVQNTGLDTIDNTQISIGFDSNADSMLNSDEIQLTNQIRQLAPLDSEQIEFNLIAPVNSGYNLCVVEANYGDLIAVDFQQFWIPYERQAILFNEIFPDPSTIYPAEFVEIVNIGSDSINFDGWKLRLNDRSISIHDSIKISSGDYTVIAEESLVAVAGDITQIVPEDWSALPNSGGTIELVDPYEYLIDSLTYFDIEQGHSLERIHLQREVNSLANWRASVARNGATPGRPNSFYVEPDSVSSGWTISPTTFSPDGDGVDDILNIIYNGDSALEYVTIKIYDSAGRLIQTVVRDQPAPARYTWLWDGHDNRDRIAPIDIYLVQIQYKSLNKGKHRLLYTAILAKKL